MKKLILTAAACAAIVAEALTVTDVTARQRWPWNNLVDVDFTINGVSGEAYYIDISATAAGGEKKLCATSFETEPIAATGRNRVVWNLGADYPNFKADDLRVTVTATPFSDSTPLYLVVDISGGTAAAKWPVRYTTAAPVHTAGVADPCKTTELWLKRVKAGSGTDGNGNGGAYSNEGYYKAHGYILTNDYYLGVFALTQAQCMNICDATYSKFTNETYRATRPVDSVHPKWLRRPYFDSSEPDAELTSSSVQGGFIMYNLRDKTGMKFDLPTEWQWVHACKAGGTDIHYGATTSDIRYADNSSPADGDANYSTANQGDWPAEYGTSYVDAYAPNPWGFYGMLGNVWECCLNKNSKGSIEKDVTYTDPMGPSGNDRMRARRGGAWNATWATSVSYYYFAQDPDTASNVDWKSGARICLTIGK